MSDAPRDPETGTRQGPPAPWPVLRGEPAPGPTRRCHRRHFARMESGGMLAMLVIAAVAVFFAGVHMGLFPDLFGWLG